MNARDWPTTYYSSIPSERPIRAVVWHSTETGVAVACHAQGSWHFEIDRDGEITAHVPERHCAWHVAAFGNNPALNRWRPGWLVASPINLSDVNWCTIGVEVVSNAALRAAGEPYTEAQYDAIIELTAYLEQAHGRLWHVGHGELQTDRSDPVAFDWQRAGFGDHDGHNGRSFVAREQLDDEVDEMAALSEEDRRILDTVHGLNANADSIVEWITKLGAQDAVISDLSGQLAAEVNTAAPQRKVATLTVTYDDGSTAELVPAA